MAKVASSLKPSLAPRPRSFVRLSSLSVSIVSEFHLQWIETHSSRWECTKATGGYRDRTKYFKDGRTARRERTSKVAKISIATSILGFCCCGLQLSCSAFTVSVVKLKLRLLGHNGFSIHSGFRLIGWILYGLYNSLQRDAKAAKHEQRGTYIDAVRLLLSVHWKENLTHDQLGHNWTGNGVLI